jgi:hypothetical protein
MLPLFATGGANLVLMCPRQLLRDCSFDRRAAICRDFNSGVGVLGSLKISNLTASG